MKTKVSNKGWRKKDKKIDWNKVLTKSLPKDSLRKRKQTAIERSPLIHCQINLIKFVASNKFDKVYSKIWNIFVWYKLFKKSDVF